MKVNFPNNAAAFDVLNDRYLGFMGYAQRKCGLDFMNAFADGRVTWEINDYGDYYTPQYIYRRSDGRHSSTMMQFYR